MIQGVKVIAFTPVGRKRYMDLLASQVLRDHEKGLIDEWVLFNNTFTKEERTYCQQIKDQFGDWVSIIELRNEPIIKWVTIAKFYEHMTIDPDAVYIRLDDDVVYLDENFVENIVNYRVANSQPYAIFPTIVNNVRTSYHMQLEGIIPVGEWGEIKNEMCNNIAWTSENFINFLHRKALTSLANGTLVKDFALKSRTFDGFEEGYISINAFAIFGRDLAESHKRVPADEERHFALWEPERTGRKNARCGEAVVIHFAYHKQTDYCDKVGFLGDYWRFVQPLPFMTVTEPTAPLADPTREQKDQGGPARPPNAPPLRSMLRQRPPVRRVIQSPRGAAVKA
jgi:hypothetical protein